VSINKSFITNFIAIIAIVISYIFNFPYNNELFYIAIFSSSGAITNTLAIYMLFEKIPFLYGSGVIESKFEHFKIAIGDMIMNQFFTKSKIENMITSIDTKPIESNLISIIENENLDLAFDNLKDVVIKSNLGRLLSIVAGDNVLDTLKKPFVARLKSALIEIISQDSFRQKLSSIIKKESTKNFAYNSIHNIIQKRLNELTPKMVKTIIEEFIKKHLQWLVVWGGFFGAIIGLIGVIMGGNLN
jgi:uncharacterized membrane protein YheB (UPF0754 family)